MCIIARRATERVATVVVDRCCCGGGLLSILVFDSKGTLSVDSLVAAAS